MFPARIVLLAATAAGLLLTGAAPSIADVPSRPDTIELPNGFQPEGIDIGPRETAYVSSLTDGSVYRADLRTGRGEILSPAVGTPSVGLGLDRRGRLFVAGGPSGTARVIDAASGALLAEYALGGPADPSAPASLINDVVVTRDAAYFTDSANPVLYRLPLARSGQLPPADSVEVIPFRGDLRYDDDPSTFEANGIETTPDRTALLVVQSRTGLLFRVDTTTGSSVQVDLGGDLLVGGDGLTRDGRTLYAVNDNRVTVLHLSRDGLRGEVGARISDDDFDVPTTVALSRGRLYLPNARFGIPSPATADYDVVSVDQP
jgi:sugar lactone lactonase YvrE